MSNLYIYQTQINLRVKKKIPASQYDIDQCLAITVFWSILAKM